MPENSAFGGAVGAVNAFDADGNALSYAITAGNTGNAFSIDATGTIRINGTLDHEALNTYNLTVSVFDGAHTVSSPYTINIANIDESPVFDTTISTFSVNENSAPSVLVGTIIASDPEAAGVTYSIVGGSVLFQISGNQIFTTGISLDYEAASSYALNIRADDGTSTPVTHTYTINVNDLNDAAPTLPTNTGTTINEGGTTTITSAMLAANDVDTGNANIVFTVNVIPANGVVLKLNGTALAVSQTFTMADVANGLVTVEHNGNEPSGPGNFTFSVSDGINNGPLGQTFSITVNPVNDAPVVDLDTISGGNNFTTAFTEDGGPVNIGGTVSVIDADNANMQSATITLTNNFDGALEGLKHPSGNVTISGVTISGSGSDTITLTGSAPLATYNAIIAAIEYNNSSDNPNTTARVVQVTVNDGAANSNTATTTITIFDDPNDADTYASQAGNDFITGDGGDDTFLSAAGDGNDIFDGGGGDDTFDVVDGDGSDELRGQGQTTWDTYNAAGATGNITYDLGAFGDGSATNGGDIDTLISIERFIGGSGTDHFVLDTSLTVYTVDGGGGVGDMLDFSGLANGVSIDMETGDAIINAGATIFFSNIESFTGSTGNDSYIVSAGETNDRFFDGLGGNDTYDASNWTGGITVNLTLGSNQVALGAIFDDVFNVETFIGTDFADFFTGDAADNIFYGGLGADIFFYSAGDDQLSGEGGGSDLYDASAAASAMTVSLIAGTVSVAGDTQTISGIENFRTGTGSDNFIMNAASAGIANDFDGGTGIDMIDYSAFAAGNNITVTLNGSTTATLTVNGGTSDLVTNIENIRGSQGNDTINSGSDTGVNFVYGDLGNDALSGGNGDKLFGEQGNDNLMFTGGAAGAFELDGGAGTDILEINAELNMVNNGNAQIFRGGAGADTLNFWGGGTITINPDGAEDRIEGIEVWDFRANAQVDNISIDFQNFMVNINDTSNLLIKVGDMDFLDLDFSTAGGTWSVGASGGFWQEYVNGGMTVRIESNTNLSNVTVTGVAGGSGVLNLNSIAPAAGYKIWDNTAESFGHSMAAMGDLNADGFDDMLIVKRNDGAAGGTGEVFSLNGAATGFAGGNMTVSTATSGQFTNVSGMQVASAGDFNGDGFQDFIISSYNEGSGQGSVKIMSGNSPNTVLTNFTGFSAASAAGTSIAGIGDINNDGYDDIIIGAPNAAGGGTARGEAYVIFGDAPATINIGTLGAADGFKIFGTLNNGFLGQSVMSAGDVNGDGMSDFMVSTPGESAVRVILGGSTFGGQGLNDGAQTGEIITITGVAVGGADQIPLLNVGDMNGDGRADIGIWEKGPAQGGAVRIFSGASLPAGGSSAAIGSAALTITAGTNRHLLEVGSVGDFNGDGYDDLAVAVGTNGSNTIDIYVVHGWNGMSGSINTTALNPSNSFHMTYAVTNTGALSSANWTASAFDITLSNAGDVNGDGLYDLFIGLPDEDANPGANSDAAGGMADDRDGASFTVYGKPVMNVIGDNMGNDVNATLLDHWRFDEMSGTTAVNSMGGINGTIVNGALINQPGRAGSAFHFDGVNDHVNVSGYSGLNGSGDFSVSMSFSLDNLTSSGVLFSQNDSAGVMIWFDQTTDHLMFTINGTTVETAALSTGQYYNIAATYDGAGNMKLYLNGALVDSSGGVTYNGTTAGLWIGNNSTGTNPFAGKIDDVKVFGIALSGADVQALHDGSYDADRTVGEISASMNGQSLLGTDGVDIFFDNGMYDVSFSGGKDGDIFNLTNGNFRNIDGGAGVDVLDTNGSLNLGSFAREDVSRLEEIRLLAGGPAQTLTLTYANIFNLLETSDNGTFKINSLGLGGNTLNIDTASAPQASAGMGVIQAALGANGPGDTATDVGGFFTFDFGGYTLYIDNQLTVNLT